LCFIVTTHPSGECSLIFLDAPDFGGGLGLKIHIRTKIRYGKELYLGTDVV